MHVSQAAGQFVYGDGYLDEDSKREIRRAMLKAVAIPGHLVPFAGREMPLPRGWGTGGMQLSASLIGHDDVLKVIDQGTDEATNAISIRAFFARVARVRTTTSTREATIIQTRHRVPETPLREGQILVLQVPLPDPFAKLVLHEAQRRKMHAQGDYGLLYLRLYENIAGLGVAALPFAHPVEIAGRYVASPSPIPRFDNPKLDRNPALMLFGAGTQRQIYAIPPYTAVKSLDFDDYPFEVQRWDGCCALCGSRESYLDEVALGDDGERSLVCSDTDYCNQRQAEAKAGSVP